MSAAAIEALARRLYERDGDHFVRVEWADENETLKDKYRDEARPVVDAIVAALNQTRRST